MARLGRPLSITMCLLAPALCGLLHRSVTARGEPFRVHNAFLQLMPTYPQRLACICPEPQSAADALQEAFPRSAITMVACKPAPLAAGQGSGKREKLSWRQGTMKALDLPARHYNLVIAFDVPPLSGELVRIAAVGGTVCLGYSRLGDGISSLLERRLRAAGLTNVDSAAAPAGVLAAGIRFRPPTG